MEVAEVSRTKFDPYVIGNNIRDLREKRKMTQMKAAEEIATEYGLVTLRSVLESSWCGKTDLVLLVYFISVSIVKKDGDDIIHFLRREMLDFTAFPVFFVSNLLLVQRKKYYFNRAMVSRNCSIVL